MEILIVGGVAAGTKTAAKLKRESDGSRITILTKERDIAYASCGVPYYVGGIISDEKELFTKTPRQFEKLTGVSVLPEMEVIALLPQEKKIQVKELGGNELRMFSYDRLILATGAVPVKLPVPGVDLPGVFTVRSPDDGAQIREYMKQRPVSSAVVAGGGLIGLEMAENLARQGIGVTLVEMMPQLLPGFDEEIAFLAERHLAENRVQVYTGEKIVALQGDTSIACVMTEHHSIDADMVILSVGVRPATELAERAGLKLGVKGAIAVNSAMQTSDPSIYAVGDCAVKRNRITGIAEWVPLGSTANQEGRAAALEISGQAVSFPGILGTSILKLFDMQAAKTGLSEKSAREAGFDPVSVILPADDKAHYYPGSKILLIKLVADRGSHRILGAQIVGLGSVDKQIDIIVTAISFGACAEGLEQLDLAYAPPFSTAMGPIITAANLLVNKLQNKFESIGPVEFWQTKQRYCLVDVRPPKLFAAGHWARSINVPIADIIAGKVEKITRDQPVLLLCKIGKTSYQAYRKLSALGWENIKILEGGMVIPQENPRYEAMT